jgi:hypothetical protein
MKLSKICSILVSAGMLTVASGCKDFYDVNVNPLSPPSAGLYSLLPATQVTMADNLGDNIGGLSQYTLALMQQLYNTRSIGNFQQNSESFSGPWGGLYRGPLTNSELIITQGTKESRWDYVGIAQLQKAYVYSQMVDLWGDIPYSEALQGAVNSTPRFDKDVDIYNGNGSIQGLFSLIDEGLANLAKKPIIPTTPALQRVDLIYGGDLGKWAKFGRTLKLKLYNQIRKTNSNSVVQSQVAPLLNGSAGTLFTDESDDFQLKYYSLVNPDNRNPGYVSDYNTSPENRIGRYFYEGMFTMNDPRVPYYFYNQIRTGSTAPATGIDYVSTIDRRFVTVRPGSAGAYASSADNSQYQTVQGLYPVGGVFDAGQGIRVYPTLGKAEAPQRLLTYYSQKFTEAELQLMVFNDPVAARAALEKGVRAAFSKVNSIATADLSPTIDTTRIKAYLNRVGANTSVSGPLIRYDRATTTEDKLEVIMYEKYVASFGYGVDVYTDFRRTHHPQIRVSADAADPNLGLLPDDGSTRSNGPFPRRLYYPTNDLILNPNSPGTQSTARIFWDR